MVLAVRCMRCLDALHRLHWSPLSASNTQGGVLAWHGVMHSLQALPCVCIACAYAVA